MKQLINEPTRITENTSSVIDHIICSDVSKVCQSGAIPVGISDHLITFCTRKIFKGQFNKHKYTTIRSLQHYSANNLVSSLINANWDTAFNADSVNVA